MPLWRLGANNQAICLQAVANCLQAVDGVQQRISSVLLTPCIHMEISWKYHSNIIVVSWMDIIAAIRLFPVFVHALGGPHAHAPEKNMVIS